MYFHPDFKDVRYADVVVIGQIADYKIIEPTERLGRYARFNVQVDSVVLGEAVKELDVWWSNSTFSLPEHMEDGSYIIALRRMALLDDARDESIELTPVQKACSSAFIYRADSEQALTIQEILSATEELDTEP